MRNYKIKKQPNFWAPDITKEQKEQLKASGYKDYNQSGVMFTKALPNGPELFLHTDRTILMLCYYGEGCTPFTPAETDSKKMHKEWLKAYRMEINVLKNIGII